MRLIVVAVAALVVLAVLVRVLEPRFAFIPMRGEDETPRDYEVRHEALTIETSDGERLRAWLLPHPSPRAFVVYFHGNGGNLSMWAPILVGIANQGYTLLAIDYRGYGASTGRPTERGLYRDVEAIVSYARGATLSGSPSDSHGATLSRSPPSAPLIYWGRSIGASMAASAATRHRAASAILESGFPDARSLFRAAPVMAFLSLFSSYRFPAARYMREAKVPALVIHGDADTVVSFNQGRSVLSS